ncbi:MAG: hypothetical protein Rhims3KO_36680 [Hyphomicrobiales bacterium]
MATTKQTLNLAVGGYLPSSEVEAEIRRLEGSQESRKLKVLLATSGALALSIWLTSKGLYEQVIEAGVADAPGMVTAAMTAGVAGSVLSVGTMALLVVAVEATRSQRRNVLLLAGTLLPFTFGISTHYAVLGNAGTPSLVYDMRDRAEEYAAYYKGAEADVAKARSAAATLQPLETTVCLLADQELHHGALTGAAGEGPTHAAYASGCANIGAILDTLNETVARQGKRGEAANAQLAELQAISGDTSMSVFERQARFRDVAGQIRALISESGSERVSARLGPQLAILEASIASLDGAGGNLGARQAAANANLKSTLGTVKKRLEKLVSEEDTTAPEEPPALRNMGSAVLAYWHRNIPQVLLAILTDLMPGWFMALLVVSRSTFEARRGELLSHARAGATASKKHTPAKRRKTK